LFTASRLPRTEGGSNTDKTDAAGIDTGDLAMTSIRKLLYGITMNLKVPRQRKNFWSLLPKKPLKSSPVVLKQVKGGLFVHHNSKSNIVVGDPVITHNSRLGIVVRLGRDNFGDYIVVKLDLRKWEFTYDPWDLEKVSEA